jgi:predicted nucleotidyltransferase
MCWRLWALDRFRFLELLFGVDLAAEIGESRRCTCWLCLGVVLWSPMRTNLDHLPASKQRELERVVEILFGEFQDAIVLGTQPHKRLGRILKIVLFGSHARGNWVNDPVGGYVSDYDLLVVVNHEKLTDVVDYWSNAEEHLLREQTIAKRLTAPVNFIVHSLEDVNTQLRLGRPFFIDIIRDGVALYDAPGHEFAKPEPLSPVDALSEAQGCFAHWYESAVQYLETGLDHASKGAAWHNKAAFELHQAAERFYHCALLVLSLSSPKSHNLKFLRSLAEDQDRRLVEPWARETKLDRRRFELLKRAYVEARYSEAYEISAEDLAALAGSVEKLQAIVNAVCQERIAALKAAAEAGSSA